MTLPKDLAAQPTKSRGRAHQEADGGRRGAFVSRDCLVPHAELHENVRRHVARIVGADLGRADQVLAERIVLLFDGAVAASAWQGAAAIEAACGAALDLLAAARAA